MGDSEKQRSDGGHPVRQRIWILRAALLATNRIDNKSVVGTAPPFLRVNAALHGMVRFEPHRPLLQLLFGGLFEYAGVAPETVAFYLGSGGSLLSDLSGRFFCWLLFYIAIQGFYHVVAPLIVRAVAWRYPKAPASQVSPKLMENMIEVSQNAFPLYVTVPVLTDLFQVKGWAATCDSVAECGGWLPTVLGCASYFLALEVVIFLDHYYLLHKWDIGKRLGQHAYHHVYKYADQLNAFSGYAFMPQDGWSQGMALPLCTLFAPAHVGFVYAMEVLTGLWTLYIHTDVAPLPWPMMGCDYHYIHHRYAKALADPAPSRLPQARLTSPDDLRPLPCPHPFPFAPSAQLQLVQLWLHDRPHGHALPYSQASQGRRTRQVAWSDRDAAGRAGALGGAEQGDPRETRRGCPAV